MRAASISTAISRRRTGKRTPGRTGATHAPRSAPLSGTVRVVGAGDALAAATDRRLSTGRHRLGARAVWRARLRRPGCAADSLRVSAPASARHLYGFTLQLRQRQPRTAGDRSAERRDGRGGVITLRARGAPLD